MRIPHLEFEIGADSKRRIDSVYNHITNAVWNLSSHLRSRVGDTEATDQAVALSATVDALVAWLWPGNVRELENAVERAVVLCRGDTIELAHLPRPMRSAESSPDALSFRVGTPLKEVERAMIETTLAACDGDKSMAARLLGITARTIYRREADWRAEDSAGAAEI